MRYEPGPEDFQQFCFLNLTQDDALPPFILQIVNVLDAKELFLSRHLSRKLTGKGVSEKLGAFVTNDTTAESTMVPASHQTERLDTSHTCRHLSVGNPPHH